MKRAFTLIELLVVIAIIVILVSLVVPAVNSIGRAQSLDTASRTVAASLELARQTAISQNRTVEVRFYKLPLDGKPTSNPVDYSALQTFVVDYDATSAFDKVAKFPAPVVISNNAMVSSLMDDTKLPEQTPTAGMTIPTVGSNYRYRSVRFKADGTADLLFSGTWSLTMVNKTDPIKANNLPTNFAKVQIDAMSGRTTVTRP